MFRQHPPLTEIANSFNDMSRQGQPGADVDLLQSGS